MHQTYSFLERQNLYSAPESSDPDKQNAIKPESSSFMDNI